MKIFLIFSNLCYNDLTEQFPTIEIAKEHFSPNTLLVEAPDYVFEYWGYDATKTGNERFIKPTVAEGCTYDETTGTIYRDEDYKYMQEHRYELRVVELIRQRYTDSEEFKILREYLADKNETTEKAFTDYNNYVIECKVTAKKEILGE